VLSSREVHSLRSLKNNALGGAAVFVVVSGLLHRGLLACLDTRGQSFTSLGGFHLWEMLLSLELTVWLMALPGALKVASPYVRMPRTRAVLLLTAGLFFMLLIGPFWYTVVRGEMKLPLTWGEHKIGFIWSISAVAHSIILAALVSTGLRAEESARALESEQLAETDALGELFEVRAVAEAMLASAGLVLTLAVLGTSALYHLVDSARALGNIGATWTPENVIGFGIYNTAVIALAYLPAAQGLQAFSTLIRDKILEARKGNPSTPDSVVVWLKQREELDRQLQTEFDLPKALAKAIPILAPLLTGILSLAHVSR
jgi:hypothetical protein